MTQPVRRLAAIMFTDLVGYGTMTQQNERLAVQLLNEHHAVLREIFPKFGGREVDVAGDGFLIEFYSATQAVQCAIEIQQSLQKRNLEQSDKPIEVRIGIHIGDVLSQDERIMGDAVNIAARVEPLAEPGGICLTRQVYDQVRSRIKIPFQSMGHQRLKNIQIPLEVYRIVWSGEVGTAPPPKEKTRIAVLPFTNISPDPEDEYFADGITDELISRLSKIRELKVIARTSVMKYKDAGMSISEIGAELGVGSILEGSVRKAGDQVRISVQFVDVATEVPEWSEDYDRDFGDVFAVQTEIAQSVAQRLAVDLLSHERKLIERTETKDAVAHEYYLQGSWNLQHRTQSGLQTSIEFFQKAIEQDPKYAVAYAGMAESYLMLGFHGFMATKIAYPAAKVAIEKALDLDPLLARARVFLAAINFVYLWELERAADELRRAIEVNPNNALAYHWYGLLHGAMGSPGRAGALLQHARELDPFSLVINGNLAFGYYYSKDYDKALAQYELVLKLEPNYLWAHYYMGSCHMQKGNYDEALAEFKLEERLWQERNPAVEFGTAYAKELRGDVGSLAKLLEDWEDPDKREREVPYLMALAYFYLGDKDKGFEWLDEAMERKSRGMLFVTCDPLLDEERKDRRYALLLKKLKLDPENVERVLGKRT